jgi:hypothetical protein
MRGSGCVILLGVTQHNSDKPVRTASVSDEILTDISHTQVRNITAWANLLSTYFNKIWYNICVHVQGIPLIRELDAGFSA